MTQWTPDFPLVLPILVPSDCTIIRYVSLVLYESKALSTKH